MDLDTYRRLSLRAAALATSGMGAAIGPTRLWMLADRGWSPRLSAVLAGWVLFTAASFLTLGVLRRGSYPLAIRLYLCSIVLVICDFVLVETDAIAVICLLLGLAFVQQAAIAADSLESASGWTLVTSAVYAPLLLLRMRSDPIDLFAQPIELMVATAGPSMALACLGILGTLTRRTMTRTSDRASANAARLAVLNAQLEEARDDALAASRAKSSFLSKMSHELRTPLNAIVGYTELLEEDLGGTEASDDLGRIRAAAGHLLQLVDQVLDLSRIEAGKLGVELVPVELGPLVGEIAASYRSRIDAHRNELLIRNQTGGGVVYLDPEKLRRALGNLLSNAARHTENGTIEILLEERLSEGRSVLEIAVRDTGCGMTAETLSRVFEPFAQGDDSHTRRHGGVGLGLTTAQRLCDLLGGTLLATSEPGVGSTFTLCIPLRNTGLTEPPAAPRVSVGGPRG